jgi:uncharacterized protein YhbP (UPF0306 family)
MKIHIESKVNIAKVMQVATCQGSKPWIASVYFVELNGKFYWLSEPHRRHSNELINNSNCAIAVVIKDDIPVIGIQAEGSAKIVKNIVTITKVMALYIKKYNAGGQFVARFKQGINKHNLYEFTANNFKIFDETKEN